MPRRLMDNGLIGRQIFASRLAMAAISPNVHQYHVDVTWLMKKRFDMGEDEEVDERVLSRKNEMRSCGVVGRAIEIRD